MTVEPVAIAGGWQRISGKFLICLCKIGNWELPSIICRSPVANSKQICCLPGVRFLFHLTLAVIAVGMNWSFCLNSLAPLLLRGTMSVRYEWCQRRALEHADFFILKKSLGMNQGRGP